MTATKATVSAVIVAAGNSTRMGVPKQFLLLQGRPLLAHTLAAFQNSDAVHEIIVVARCEDIKTVQELSQTQGITKLKQVVVGGNSRQESVWRGVQACKSCAGYIAVHDGARPLVTPEIIGRVVTAAAEYGAAAAAVPTKDTVKRVDKNGFVLETPPRETLWNVQTPQIFERELYLRAAAHTAEIGLAVTDDCQMVEALGHRVKLVEGSYTNIKITTPEDVQIAEGWLP